MGQGERIGQSATPVASGRGFPGPLVSRVGWMQIGWVLSVGGLLGMSVAQAANDKLVGAADPVAASQAPANQAPASQAHASQAHWAPLLQAAWEGSGAAAQQAFDQAYRQAQQTADQRLAPASRRYLEDAYLLGLVKQRRYDEAVDWLAQPHGLAADDILRGRTHVWLLVVTRQYEAAQIRLADLLQSLAARPWDDWTPAQQGFVRFAGRISGYLLGPVETAPLRRAWEETLQPIYQALPEPARTRFEEGQRDVLQQYQTLRAELDGLIAQQKQEHAEAKQHERARIERESQQADQRHQEIAREREELRRSLRDQLQDLAQRDSALAARLSELGLTADTLFDAVVRTEWGIQNLIDLYENTEDDQLAFWWLAEIDRLDFRQNRNLGALRGVDRAAAQTQWQRQQTQREAHWADQAFRQQSLDLEAEQTRMVRWQKQLANREKKLERPLSKISRDAAVKQQQLRALSSYEPYPFEVVRSYLLGVKADAKSQD